MHGDQDDKRRRRKEKAVVKRAGTRRRRRDLERELAEDPEDATTTERHAFRGGRDESASRNGEFRDSKRSI